VTTAAEIAVIGGSGFYAFLDGAVEHAVDTPYGSPSAPIAVGTVDTDSGPRSVAFLPRHGRHHEHPAHVVPYRANLWALRSLGVRQVVAPCAVGSLRPELGPGTVVAPDQLVDRTTSRVQTYFDQGACHVGFADPYCSRLRAEVLGSMRTQGADVVDGGTMVVIDGPRFSTRAESQWYAAQGWSLVNMTGHPEAVLARELALCYSAVALVTDLDAGLAAEEAVSQAEVFRVFAEHTERLRALLRGVVAGLPLERDCACLDVHDGMTLPVELP
jgi:5'-methylthioadenosine phosphorylase